MMTSQLLAVVTLETNDVPNYIHIYENDDIELLIAAFCEVNQITQLGKQFILSEIKNNLKSINRSNMDIIVQTDQQSSNQDNQDQSINNNQMFQQQNNHHLFNTNLTLNTFYDADQFQTTQKQDRQQIKTETTNQRKLVQQQYGSEFLKNNQKIRKAVISPNYRYGKTCQQTKNRFATIFSMFSKQNNYQYTSQRKKIFDADQPKIKYKQDLEVVRNIFRQLDSDLDGQISSELINLKIAEQTLQQIAPVLYHMQEQRMILDFDSFVYLLISFNILIY